MERTGVWSYGRNIQREPEAALQDEPVVIEMPTSDWKDVSQMGNSWLVRVHATCKNISNPELLYQLLLINQVSFWISGNSESGQGIIYLLGFFQTSLGKESHLHYLSFVSSCTFKILSNFKFL